MAGVTGAATWGPGWPRLEAAPKRQEAPAPTSTSGGPRSSGHLVHVAAAGLQRLNACLSCSWFHPPGLARGSAGGGDSVPLVQTSGAVTRHVRALASSPGWGTRADPAFGPARLWRGLSRGVLSGQPHEPGGTWGTVQSLGRVRCAAFGASTCPKWSRLSSVFHC